MSIKFEDVVLPSVEQWRAIIIGTRNPMNSWDKSDSHYCNLYDGCEKTRECDSRPSRYEIGSNDLNLMKRLRNAGTDHRKFMRMIPVIVTITAPLYWWKEFDTYKVGTVANSCSTMHKIHAKEFTLGDFSHEHLKEGGLYILNSTIDMLNRYRLDYLNSNVKTLGVKKDYWWQMIQLLPSSYNQKRTVMLNYEVLANIYKSRKNHKLDEWAEHTIPERKQDPIADGYEFAKYINNCGFCDWIKTLPYSELITGETANAED